MFSVTVEYETPGEMDFVLFSAMVMVVTPSTLVTELINDVLIVWLTARNVSVNAIMKCILILANIRS